MSVSYEVLPTLTPRMRTDAFARDLLAGLLRRPRRIPSMYFYDEIGSRLFQQITECDEYYLTRCEHEILQRSAAALAALLGGGPFRLVELGAGDGRKTKVLLGDFARRGLRFEYMPVDICEDTLVELTGSLGESSAASAFRVRGIVAEYFDALSVLDERDKPRDVVLFLGSNIGNFEPAEAVRFLRGVRAALAGGDYLLIGFDLRKDQATIERAYNDGRGITRAFNLNLLDRINRELGGDFRREAFEHVAPYNVELHRMESWLISRRDQQVRVDALGRTFSFRRGEGIHVESSYKFSEAGIHHLASAAGFTVEHQFFDHRRWFVDSLWRVA
jgi:L-histidine Nalpha-methyltransferase